MKTKILLGLGKVLLGGYRVFMFDTYYEHMKGRLPEDITVTGVKTLKDAIAYHDMIMNVSSDIMKRVNEPDYIELLYFDFNNIHDINSTSSTLIIALSKIKRGAIGNIIAASMLYNISEQLNGFDKILKDFRGNNPKMKIAA